MPYFAKGTQPAPDPHIWDSVMAHPEGLGGGMVQVSELDTTKNGGYVLKGAPIYLDYATKAIHFVKSAEVISGGTSSAPRVKKNHLFKAGEFVYISGAAVTISSIDSSNADYDVLTLSGAVAGYEVGAFLENAAAAGASPTKKYTANCLLGNSEKMIAGVTGDCIFRIDHWLEKKHFPHAISAATVADLSPNIIIKG